MYSLELLWPIDNGVNDYAVVAESDSYDELFAIAKDFNFRMWAAGIGCAFIEIWAQSNNIVLMDRV